METECSGNESLNERHRSIGRFVIGYRQRRILLNKGDTVVTENEGSGSGSYTINQGWGAANQRGLKLSVPVEKQKVGEFKGTLSWSLVMAP